MNHQELDKPLEQAEDRTVSDETDEAQVAQPEAKVWSRKQLKYIVLLIVAAIVVILVSILVQRPSHPQDYIETSGYAGVFLMAVIGSASPFWPLPGSWAAFAAAGLGLDPWLVGLAAGIGEPIGELTFYTVGYGGQIAINRWKRYAQIMSFMRRYGGPTIFLVSLIPNFLIKLATTAAGALRYPLWKFFIYCWAGKTIKSLAFAFAGAGLFDWIMSCF